MEENTPAWQNPRLVITIIVVLAVLSSIAILWPKPDQQAPEISFTLTSGEKLSLASLRDRPVLVLFWATTCKICIAKTPEIFSLYKQLNPVGLEIVAVAMPYDPPTRVVAMATKMKMPYPVALDINAEVVRAFGNVKVTPTTFLIGPSGNITWHRRGKFDTNRLEILIRELIQNHNAI